MPRVLSLRHTVVTPAHRNVFHDRAGRLRAHYAGRRCRYWLFEDETQPGAYVEFFEAGDRRVLENAHASAPDAGDTPKRTYVEIELA